MQQKHHPLHSRKEIIAELYWASSEDAIQMASSKSHSLLESFGNVAKMANSGHGSRLESSGSACCLANSGIASTLTSMGYNSRVVSCGNVSKIDIQGEKSVGVNIGIGGTIKGVIGNRITLAEYNKKGVCVCVKSCKIDGKKIKENTRYKLENKKFVEVE